MTKADIFMVARYALVMGLGWLADVAVFALAVAWMNIPVSQLLARVTGAAVGFVFHKHFSFPQTAGIQSASALLRYAMVWVFGYFASTGLILLLVGGQLPPLGAKVLVEIGMVPVNFFLFRLFVFARRG